VPDVDFRLPTNEELDAVEAFMLSIGRQADLSLPLSLRGTVPARGQEIFLDDSLGKCNLCHRKAGATANLGAGSLGNTNFNTGVEDLPDQPARLTGEIIPVDGGLGRSPRVGGGFGDGSFNIPPLVESADTPPFFHNNAVFTLEEAVAFYNSPEFNNSSSANEIGGIRGGISLTTTQVQAVAAFLRVINVLENIRSAIESQEKALLTRNKQQASRFLTLAAKDIDDAINVFEGGGLHLDAVILLPDSKALMTRRQIQEAIDKLKSAQDIIVDPS
jgi:hypothetical protein